MKLLEKLHSGRVSVSHGRFSVIFTASLFVVFNALTIDRIAEWFQLADGIDYVGLSAYLFFGWCAFLAVFVLLAHKWTIKPLAFTFIVLGASATYFIAKYNVAIERTMLSNVLHTDVTEARSLLSIYMLPYVIFLIVLPSLVVSRIDITFRKAARYLVSSLALFVAAIVVGMGSVYMQFNSIQRAMTVSHRHIVDTLVPVNVIRTIGSVVQHTVDDYNKRNYKEPDIDARVSSNGDLVIVLAIGETSRQKNFSLYGYERKNTNPVLSELDDLHILNGQARIGSTMLAIPEILERDDVQLPAITARAGIATSCLVNYTLYDSCLSVGEVEVDQCGHGGKCYDEDVLPLLEEQLHSWDSGYKFVILHLGGGSHGPNFSNRHPPEFQKFNPQCFEADIANHCTVEQLYNSYDNTVLYVDYVVSEAISRLDASGVPYVFIYLSDHGESLMEDGRLFHGMPPGIPLPPEQSDIPLIVKSSVPISIDKRAEYAQQDVYDSVLDLFSIETQKLHKDRAFIRKL
jgi:lipid A ethanolaminephosphotransferase